jgi:LmbE family N-acetylglucosaminyl deacetylase
MMMLKLGKKKDTPCRILCLGAHSDDIEIGCGGTILRLLEEDRNAIVHWVVFSSDECRAREAEQAAKLFLSCAKEKTVETNGFEDTLFPSAMKEIKAYFQDLKLRFSPDVIFTHFRNDLHQDHRVISECTWNTFRDHLILEYEIPKYDGDFGSPNVFVPLSRSTCERKVKHILSAFESQKCKRWFTEETFQAVLRLRGVESNSASDYAEGFYCRKILI